MNWVSRSLQNYRQARSMTFEFIEIWYNRTRLHPGLGYQSPVQDEKQLEHKQAA